MNNYFFCAFYYLKIFINFNRLGKRRRITINFSIKKDIR
jgi:hypothetical protein